MACSWVAAAAAVGCRRRHRCEQGRPGRSRRGGALSAEPPAGISPAPAGSGGREGGGTGGTLPAGRGPVPPGSMSRASSPQRDAFERIHERATGRRGHRADRADRAEPRAYALLRWTTWSAISPPSRLSWHACWTSSPTQVGAPPPGARVGTLPMSCCTWPRRTSSPSAVPRGGSRRRPPRCPGARGDPPPSTTARP